MFFTFLVAIILMSYDILQYAHPRKHHKMSSLYVNY